MKLQSTYALLDVKRGRVGLNKLMDKSERVRVTIEGEIDAVYGDDDGESQEFTVDVSRVTVHDWDKPE